MQIGIIGRGKMGSLISSTAISKGHEVLAMADINNKEDLTSKKVDVVLDFSHRDNLTWVEEYCKESGTALVYGTTGLSQEQISSLHELSNSNAVFYSANYSYGVAVLQKLVKQASELLADDYDIEIVEEHHNQKQDAPSGTAVMLLNTIDPDNDYKHVYGRQGMVGKREKEIGIHAIRGGTVAGIHTVSFYGDNETIEVKHIANSRQIFVNGAIKAAEYLNTQGPGFYNMDDLIGE